MIIQDYKSINAQQIAVTTSATKLFDLIDTAGAADQELKGKLNAADLRVEGNVRISWDKDLAPTATEGFVLKPGFYTFRNRPIAELQLISATGASVDAYVTVGFSYPEESENVSPDEVAIDAATSGLVAITSDNAVFEDTSFVAGDSPATHDVNTALGQNGQDGYIICDGAGDILVEVSADGATYGDQWTQKAGEVVSLKGMSVDTIRITHSGTDSAYRINVR